MGEADDTKNWLASSRASRAATLGVQTQAAFEVLLDELGTERLRKVIQYGEARYHPGQPGDFEWDMVMAYSDVYRKTIRLEALIWSVVRRPAEDLVPMDTPKVRETFLELASYALMGVQLIDQHKEAR